MGVTRYRRTSQIKYNIQAHLEREFINSGLYTNISSGYIDVTGSRTDKLTRIDGNLYESFFNEWIYETDASGVSSYNTVTVSGVTIDGVFNARGSSPYKPAINYRNGSVKFLGTSVPSSSTVETAFSYKHVDIDFVFSESVNQLFSRFKDAVDFTANAVPSGVQKQLPSVVVDMQRSDIQPWAIGGSTKIEQTVVLHVLTNTMHENDQIVDLLTEESIRSVIKGVDYNKAPELFTGNGDKASTYVNYTDLQNNLSYKWFNIYIDETKVIEQNQFLGLNYARIHWLVRIYKT